MTQQYQAQLKNSLLKRLSFESYALFVSYINHPPIRRHAHPTSRPTRRGSTPRLHAIQVRIQIPGYQTASRLEKRRLVQRHAQTLTDSQRLAFLDALVYHASNRAGE